MRRTGKRIRYTIITIAALACTAWGLQAYLFPSNAETNLITAKPRIGTIEDTVLAAGTVSASKLVSVGAQVSGQIRVLHVELGDQITEGDLIAEIDPSTQENDLREAEASLANIKAQLAAQQATLKQAELDFARQKKMRALDASPQEDFDAAEATLAIAKADIDALNAQITQAEIAVDTARIDLGYTKITAPMDGTVVALPVKEGQTVNASQSAPTIIKLAKLDTVTIKAEVSEADIIHINKGLPVTFTVLGDSNTVYQSTLRAIEPAPTAIEDDDENTDDEAVYYNALFDVANPDHLLRLWMTAEVSIILNKSENALIVPSAALSGPAADGSYFLDVINKDGHPEPRTVSVGLNTNVNAEIIDGVTVEDEIVIGKASGADVTSASPVRRNPQSGMF
ncbi:efflux RND transporter periplasmic adaptor subunit [Thalassospira profundimaris]|uniref:Hemolysin secretion protein D n=1 Tax=Thalassospira profundimaris TaxID=502049 RepID=A0A367WKS7_9PROT|nr:efflux RND transporter periplasmic adaptor subunit [Thalassospira profundimaris]RCK42043.1 hemolysin secretion protein D [Thalassospira profundimaris]